MSTVTIAIPDSLAQFLSTRIKECGYESVSDYLEALIVEDQTHRAEDQFAEMLIQSLQTSAFDELKDDFRHIPHPVRQRGH